jgi:ketosteroid isomerase-like protein
MSEENVEIVRAVYDGVSTGDAEAVLALYDTDVEWDFTKSPFRPMLKRDLYRGHEGIRDLIRERYEGWFEVADDLIELIDAGDQVVSVIRTRGSGRRSGASVEMTYAGVWTISDRKVSRVVWLDSRAEALQAAGLSE